MPSLAAAAGLYVPDTGTTGRARGGAFAAAADDPLAMYYNPAGLADQHQKNQLLFDLTDLTFNEKFDRTGIPADGMGAGTSATNQPPPQIVPDIIYTHSFSDKFTFGGGIHAPAGARYHFKSTGPQRFTNSNLFLTEAGLGITAGYRINKFVGVGLTLETLITGVDQKFTISTHTPGDGSPTEDPSHDSPGSLKVDEMLNPTGVLGVKVYPTETIEIGLAYRPQVHLDMPGTLKAPPAQPEKVHFTSDLASILRFGARYVQPAWDYELDFVYEDWSNHKEDKVTADDGQFINSSSQAVPRKWKAAYSIRGGSTFKIAEKLKGMAGLYYETSAVPKETMDVGSFDAPKIGIDLGAKYDIGTRFTLSGNLGYTMLTSQTVTNSTQRQQSAFGPPLVAPTDFTIIGNGKYSGNYTFLGLSLLTKF